MRIIAAPYDWRTEHAITGYHLPVGCVGSMDLRPLPDQGSKPRPGSRNLGLFVLPDESPLPSDAKELPDHWTLTDRRWLQSALRHNRTPQADTLAGIINWLRTEGADPSGETAMRPAMPDSRGILEWQLGGLRHREKWTPKHSASVDLFKRVHADIMEHSAPLHRKFLGASVIKTGVDFRTLLYRRMWSEMPLQPTTVFTETFPGTTGTLGGDQTWTEIAGSTFWENSGGVGRRANNTASADDQRLARCEAVLSSDDMIVRCSVPTHNRVSSGNQSGVCARFASAASTCYFTLNQRASSAGDVIGLYKFVTGTITSINTISIDLAPTYHPAILVDGSVQRYLSLNVTDGGDTAITGNVRGGIYSLVVTVGDVTFDNWEARDMVETASGSASGVRNPLRGPIG